MNEVFEEFKVFLAGQKIIDMSFIFEFIATSLEDPKTQQIAYAFSSHARDLLQFDSTMSPLDLMTECYRRTFFDPELSALYGTEDFLNGNAEAARSFLDHISLQQNLIDMGKFVHEQASGVQ